jgi:hypothetical protein
MKRFGALVVGGEVSLDRVDQGGDAVEDPAADGSVGELSEEISTIFSHELAVGVKCSSNPGASRARP